MYDAGMYMLAIFPTGRQVVIELNKHYLIRLSSAGFKVDTKW
jgi:hypothetical protein